jgi:FMN reductase
VSGTRTVVLVGNPRTGSRTRAAAEQAARAVLDAAGLDGTPAVVDLAELAPYLLIAPQPEAVRAAVAAAVEADVLLVASPTYKATYTGLLKVFCDQIPTGALAGSVALPLLVMGAPGHALAVDAHLRPLLVELGAQVPTPGLALAEADLGEPAVLADWAARVGPAVRRLVAARGAVPEEVGR